MAPLADLMGVSRQSAILAFQFGEFSTPMLPTSGITVGVLELARIPWLTWAKWMLPLQPIYLALSLAPLAYAGMTGWWCELQYAEKTFRTPIGLHAEQARPPLLANDRR